MTGGWPGQQEDGASRVGLGEVQASGEEYPSRWVGVDAGEEEAGRTLTFLLGLDCYIRCYHLHTEQKDFTQQF